MSMQENGFIKYHKKKIALLKFFNGIKNTGIGFWCKNTIGLSEEQKRNCERIKKFPEGCKLQRAVQIETEGKIMSHRKQEGALHGDTGAFTKGTLSGL